MKVKVDMEKCIGCGVCESICPQVFKMKDGKAIVKAQKDLACVKEADEACPVDAIEVK